MSYVPASGEVIAEEISEELSKNGVLREEQGPTIRSYIRIVADEISKLLQVVYVR